MKKTLTILFSFLLLALSFTVNAAEVILNPTLPQTTSAISPSTETVFTRSLTVGSSGRDVMALKKILSLELKTTQDTSAIFTANTASEVKALQEKYAVEILIPNNLSAGTGYVGPSTIKKLNQLAPTYFIKLSDFVAPVVSSTTNTIKNTFVSTLKLGFIGDEVVLLKTILNADPATALNPKNSTSIYDLATQIAVNKFQEKYASEVLVPSGLTSGTGTVGPATRKKLNALLNQTLVSIGISSATKSIQTTPTKQVFTVSGSLGGISGSVSANLTDGDISSQYCDGSTLVVTKIGFGSTYDTKTPNSSQCSNTVFTGTTIPLASGECTKTTYTTGPWGACNHDSVQTRTVTKVVSTTSCPYFGFVSVPASSQSCTLPQCPSDKTLYVGGEVGTISSCLNTTFTVHVMKAGTKYSYDNDGKACMYDKNRLLAFTPFAAGLTVGGYTNAPADLKVLGDALSSTMFCQTLSDSGNWRILSPSAHIKIEP